MRFFLLSQKLLHKQSSVDAEETYNTQLRICITNLLVHPVPQVIFGDNNYNLLLFLSRCPPTALNMHEEGG